MDVLTVRSGAARADLRGGFGDQIAHSEDSLRELSEPLPTDEVTKTADSR